VEDLAAYVYGLLSSSAYFERFAENLKEPGLRVPITADPELFNEACKHGRIMIWLHSFGARCNSPSRGGKIPRHTDISWTQPVVNIPASSREISYNPDSQELYIGQGIVSGVRREVWDFSVTSWKVVQKWLAFRTGVGSGRAASRPKPLDLIRPTKWEDAWNIELLELLTVLTRTVEAEQHAEELLARICVGPFIEATSLPYPTPIERKEPKV
jgi:hypothetical protein